MKKPIVFFLCFLPLLGVSQEEKNLPNYEKVHEVYSSNVCSGFDKELEMIKCIQNSLKKSQEQMQQSLSKLRSQFLLSNQRNRWERLEASQRAWNKLLESACDFEYYDSRDGTAYEWNRSVCVKEKLNERNSYLAWYIEHP